MQVGSIWGHGSYVAPDWTADWLHREAIFILDKWAQAEFAKSYGELDEEFQGQLVGRLSKMMHANTFDLATGVVTLDPVRAEAFESNVDHYRTVFIGGNEDYAIPANSISSEERLRKFSAFVFWTSWAASTTRPGDIASYTNNWRTSHWWGIAPQATTLSGPVSA